MHDAADIRWTRLDQFRFHHELAGQPDLALIMFSAVGCNSCRAWKHLLSTYAAGRKDLQLFEVDAGQDPGLAREFGVFHLPTLFLYRDGHYHARIESEATGQQLDAAIATALAMAAEDAP